MKIYCDGFTIRKNPSPIGGGYTVADTKGKVLLTNTEYKEGYTNNEGELKACLFACGLARKGDTVVVDSTNTINWIKKPTSKARRDLMPIAKEVGALIRDKDLQLKWEPRERNTAGHYNEKLGLEPIFTRA